jgi:hypothetical protein
LKKLALPVAIPSFNMVAVQSFTTIKWLDHAYLVKLLWEKCFAKFGVPASRLAGLPFNVYKKMTLPVAIQSFSNNKLVLSPLLFDRF